METPAMKNLNLTLLRAMLIVVALTGLFSGVAVFIPWKSTVAILERLGIEGVPTVFSSPIIEYWILMMAAACIVVGYLYLVAALNPQKYKSLLPILGWGLILIGVTTGYHGFRLGISPWPFYADLGICAVCGPGIVWLSRTT
jgi:hypothetical protein